MTNLDHLVVVVPDLESAVRDVEAAIGIRPELGGAHVGLGTHNALLGLGTAYLELIARDPDQPDPDTPRPFGADGIEAPSLVTFAVRPGAGESIDDVVARAAEAGHDPGPVVAMHRVRPDGVRLDWRLTLPDPSSSPLVPFVIDWGETASPTATAPAGAALTSFTITIGPGSAGIRTRLHALEVAETIHEGPADGLRATISGPDGTIELRS